MMHQAAEPAEIQGAPSTQPAAGLLSSENTRTSQAASQTATIVPPEKPAVGTTGQAAVTRHEGMKQPPALPGEMAPSAARPRHDARAEQLPGQDDVKQVPIAALHPKPPQPSERDEQAVTPSEKPASGKDDAKAPAPTTHAQPKLAGPSEERGKKDK